MTEALWSLLTRPWAQRPDTLLAVALLLVLAALLGEAAWRLLRWPRLIGYVTVGSVLAAGNVGARGSEPALRLAVDVALALLLFETGARLNLRWLNRNRKLLPPAWLKPCSPWPWCTGPACTWAWQGRWRPRLQWSP
jgi:hypothetical protein